jgi:hypothetical protein
MPEYKKQVAKGILIAAIIIIILGSGSNYYFQRTATSNIVITTDKTSYSVGSTIIWTASGLTKGQSYVVGADLNDNIYHSGSFTATSSTMTGSYAVGDNIVGAKSFVIGQSTSSGGIEILASVTMTLTV